MSRPITFWQWLKNICAITGLTATVVVLCFAWGYLTNI